MKLALAYAFIGVIAGEFILSSGGLGYGIAYAYESFENRTDVRAACCSCCWSPSSSMECCTCGTVRLARRRGQA